MQCGVFHPVNDEEYSESEEPIFKLFSKVEKYYRVFKSNLSNTNSGSIYLHIFETGTLKVTDFSSGVTLGLDVDR